MSENTQMDHDLSPTERNHICNFFARDERGRVVRAWGVIESLDARSVTMSLIDRRVAKLLSRDDQIASHLHPLGDIIIGVNDHGG